MERSKRMGSFLKITVLSIILAIGGQSFAHDWYISITTIRYNQEKKSFEVEVKLTAHDLEKAVKLHYNQDLKLGGEKEHPQSDKIISNYLNNYLDLWVNGAKSKLEFSSKSFIGKEVENDENMWIYLEFKAPRVLKNITVKNRILMDTFPGQQNITHVENGDQKQSYTFVYGKNQKTFLFED